MIHLRWKKSGGSNVAVQRATHSLCVVFMLSFLLHKGGMGGIRRDRKREKDRDGRENESDKEKQVKKKQVDGGRETENKKKEGEKGSRVERHYA